MDLLLTKYLTAGLSYEGLQRIETLPVPEAALREALLNAIIHKDYAVGAPIQISVYADKLMLWNPGELPPAWTVAKLKGKHPSQPFNPDVANAFFRVGLIEAWGRGIERIMEACRAAGAPAPTLRYEPSGLWAEFTYGASRPGPTVSGSKASEGGTTQETAKTSPVSGDTTRNGYPERLPKKLPKKTAGETTQEHILALLRAEPFFTRRELARRVGIGPDGIRYHLDKLKAAGVIRHLGPTKAGQWEVLR